MQRLSSAKPLSASCRFTIMASHNPSNTKGAQGKLYLLALTSHGWLGETGKCKQNTTCTLHRDGQGRKCPCHPLRPWKRKTIALDAQKRSCDYLEHPVAKPGGDQAPLPESRGRRRGYLHEGSLSRSSAHRLLRVCVHRLHLQSTPVPDVSPGTPE